MDRNETDTPDSRRDTLLTIHELTEESSIRSCGRSIYTVGHDPSIYTGDSDAQSMRTMRTFDTVTPGSEKVSSLSGTTKEVEFGEARLVNILPPAPTSPPPPEESWYKKFRTSKWFGLIMFLIGLGVMLILSLTVALVSVMAHSSSTGPAGQTVGTLFPGAKSTATKYMPSAESQTTITLPTSVSTAVSATSSSTGPNTTVTVHSTAVTTVTAVPTSSASQLATTDAQEPGPHGAIPLPTTDSTTSDYSRRRRKRL